MFHVSYFKLPHSRLLLRHTSRRQAVLLVCHQTEDKSPRYYLQEDGARKPTCGPDWFIISLISLLFSHRWPEGHTKLHSLQPSSASSRNRTSILEWKENIHWDIWHSWTPVTFIIIKLCITLMTKYTARKYIEYERFLSSVISSFPWYCPNKCQTIFLNLLQPGLSFQ